MSGQPHTDLAAGTVDYFEDRVTYQEDPDPLRACWIVGDDQPRAGELLDFQRAAQPAVRQGRLQHRRARVRPPR